MMLAETFRCDVPDSNEVTDAIFKCYSNSIDIIGIFTALGTIAAVVVSLRIAGRSARDTKQRDQRLEQEVVFEQYVSSQYSAIRWLIKPDLDAVNAYRINARKLEMHFENKTLQFTISRFIAEMDKAVQFFYAMTRLQDRAAIAKDHNHYAEVLLEQHEAISLALFLYHSGKKKETALTSAFFQARGKAAAARKLATTAFPDIEKEPEYNKKLRLLWEYDGYFEGSPTVYGTTTTEADDKGDGTSK